jgi:serine/threonine-protein kinase RsbT
LILLRGGEPLSLSANGAADVHQPRDIRVGSQDDVPTIARATRRYADLVGLDLQQTECAVLAATELATNLARYAAGGHIQVGVVSENGRTGLQMESHDTGPGISDISQALEDGFSTGGGLGSGLPGVRRLMDEFEIASSSAGTRILARKWPTKR